jgi:CPA1 family monovalent cation:H+ antiporter
MDVFEWIAILRLGAVLLVGAARRIGAPYPALLALGGAGLDALAADPFGSITQPAR